MFSYKGNNTTMKRYRDVQQVDMSNMLMFLSTNNTDYNQQHINILTSRKSTPNRVFECKTCNREFSSFQALGGHRASHKKPRHNITDDQQLITKPRVHECSICGLEFAIGQALGGHMRRHRATNVVPHHDHHQLSVEDHRSFSTDGSVLDHKNSVDDHHKRKLGFWLDLNMPVASAPTKIFGFELVQNTNTSATPVVMLDCFH